MVEINNQTRSKIDEKKIKDIAEKFIANSRYKNSHLSIAFVGDKVMQKMNREYRGYDKPTDVLSFPEEKEIRKDSLGEIVIDYAQIKRQAKNFSDSVEEELIFIFVHGLYHLLGYEDDTELGKRKMDELTKKFISKLKK
jgi:probable rRNA maturation factor